VLLLPAVSVPSTSVGPLACNRVKPPAPVARSCPVGSSVRLQAWRSTSPPPFACSVPVTETVAAVSEIMPPVPGPPAVSAFT